MRMRSTAEIAATRKASTSSASAERRGPRMLLTSLQSRASRTRHPKRRRAEQGDGLKAVQQGVAGPGRPDEPVERFAYTECDTFGFEERHGLGAASALGPFSSFAAGGTDQDSHHIWVHDERRQV